MSSTWARVLGLLALLVAVGFCLRHSEPRHVQRDATTTLNAVQPDHDDDTTDIDDVRLDDGGANDVVTLHILAPLVGLTVSSRSVDEALPALQLAESSPSRAPPAVSLPHEI